MTHTLAIASLFSSFQTSACASRSVIAFASAALLVEGLVVAVREVEAPVGVNSSGITVDALDQSGPQPARTRSPSFAGSRTMP
jgi:hypothetical protein